MTDWEEHYSLGDTPWDKGSPSPGLVDFLKSGAVTGRVLVPGCGLGHDVRALSLSDHVQAVGIDIAPSAIIAADRFPKAGQERYVEADLFDLQPEFTGTFDWVCEHTCFCAIDPSERSRYVDRVAKLLRADGRFLGVFYLDPAERREDDRDGGPPFGVESSQLDQYFENFFEIENVWIPDVTYPGREGREEMRLMVVRG